MGVWIRIAQTCYQSYDDTQLKTNEAKHVDECAAYGQMEECRIGEQHCAHNGNDPADG
jgi:hypothetical protein